MFARRDSPSPSPTYTRACAKIPQSARPLLCITVFPLFGPPVSVMNDLLCLWMLFQAARRRKRERDRATYSRLKVGEQGLKREGATAREWHRGGMKTALVNGFLLSSTFTLSLFYCLFPSFPYRVSSLLARGFLAIRGAQGTRSLYV